MSEHESSRSYENRRVAGTSTGSFEDTSGNEARLICSGQGTRAPNQSNERAVRARIEGPVGKGGQEPSDDTPEQGQARD